MPEHPTTEDLGEELAILDARIEAADMRIAEIVISTGPVQAKLLLDIGNDKTAAALLRELIRRAAKSSR